MDYQAIARYFLIIFFLSVGTIVFAAATVWIVIIFRQQMKLKYSITLVELQTSKLTHFIVDGVLIAIILYLTMKIVNIDEEMGKVLTERLGFQENEIRLLLLGVMGMAVAGLGISLTLTLAKSAVMDRGVHFGTTFLDWYHLYDYHVDEENCRVILSSNKNGPLTLQGTSIPFRYSLNDAEKLKFILNKNKNKFVPRYEL